MWFLYTWNDNECVWFIIENPNPTREEIITAMDANLCRCGSYNRIIEAIEKASKQLL